MGICCKDDPPKRTNLSNVKPSYNNNKSISSDLNSTPEIAYINRNAGKPFVPGGISKNIKYNNSYKNNSLFGNTNFHFQIYYSNIIGKGPFGTIYLGIDNYTNQEVAIKMEPKNNSLFFNSYLLKEIEIYSKLGSYHSIPKIYWSGSNLNNNILVMELLGPSLEKVFCQRFKQFSLLETINIGLQILDILEYIHNKNIIHRDIKTTCFYIKENDISNYSNIYIIDFGNAKEYIDPKTGYHIPFTKGNSYIGDYRFSSINAFLGYEMSRRDDIESLGYMLIYFLKGSLPWHNSRDRNFIKNLKLSISLDSLCDGVPLGIKDFVRYSFNLNFSDKPNYSYLRNLLNNCKAETLECVTMPVSVKKSSESFLSAPHTVFVPYPGEKNNNNEYVRLNDAQFDNESRNTNNKVNEEDRDIIEKLYIQNKHSQEFNKILRTLGPFGLDEEDLQLFYALNNVINSQTMKKNYLVYRYVDNNYLRSVFNFIPSDYDINYNLSMIRNQIGSIKIEKGFMSCYMTEKHLIERNVKLKVQIPQGSHAYITRNKIESEIILPYNTKYKVINAYKIGFGIIQIDIVILIEKSYSNDDLDSLREPFVLRREDFIDF